MRANSDAFADHTFVPRVLRDVSSIDTSTTILGRPAPLPLILAPTGFTRAADPDGARASVAAGLGAGGEAGVDKVIGLLGDDIRRTMALVGRPSLADLTPDFLQRRNV